MLGAKGGHTLELPYQTQGKEVKTGSFGELMLPTGLRARQALIFNIQKMLLVRALRLGVRVQ